MLTIKTSMGNIGVEMYEKEAPGTVANFLGYVADGHYNGTVFHRVINGFMIQGGGFDAAFRQRPTKSPIKNEAYNGLKNERGTLAMARTSEVDSATAEFFINVADNDFLDHKSKTADGFGYCVFAKVVDGMDVVDKIKSVQTGSKDGHRDVPNQSVIIKEISNGTETVK